MRLALCGLRVALIVLVAPGLWGVGKADDAPLQANRITQLIDNLTSEHEAVRDGSAAGAGRFAVNIEPLVSVEFDESADPKNHVYELKLSAEQASRFNNRRP